jgi:hypothetical protein
MGAERLEPRAMMAIFTYGRPDGSTLVAIDGNASLTDLYLRNTLGGVQVATNSQFAAVPTFDEADWRNGTPQPPSFNPNLYSIDSSAPIYVTNATPNFFEFETEADGFLDGDDSNVTDFVLSNGNLNTATPGAVNGELRLDNRAWSFTNNGTGGLLFTQIAGPVAGPAPRNVLSTVSPGVTEPDSRGQGVRGAITIQWTAPVSTFVDTCPRIDVSYTYRNFTGAPADPPPPSLSGVDSNLGVSAGSRVTFSIQGDPLDKEITLGGTTLGIVPGTLVNSGTITVHDVLRIGNTGSGYEDLRFDFSDATGTLVFTPQQNDWLQIAPGSTPGSLRFVNAFPAGDAAAGAANVQPGRVTIEGVRRWFEYRMEDLPTQVTVWPGLDVSNAITVELTRGGGSFNVLSPIVNAPSLAALGTEVVNFQAPVSVTGSIRLARGEVTGSMLPTVRTARIEAPNAAASYSFAIVGDSLTVGPSGSLSGALPPAGGEPSTPSGAVNAVMSDADLFALGTIYATTQFYDLRSSTGAYLRNTFFTTRAGAGGPDSGLIRGGTVVVAMANPGNVLAPPTGDDPDISVHTVDLRTQVNAFRTRAASPDATFPAPANFPYELSVRELDDVTIDAVAGSRRSISISAGGSIIMGGGLSTVGDVTLESLSGGATPSRLSVSGPLATTRGRVRLIGDSVAIGDSVRVTAADDDELRDDIWITANAGDVLLEGSVSANNRVKIQQANAKQASGKVSGSALVTADSLLVDVQGAVGDSSLRPTDLGFFLRTNVDSISGSVGGGASFDEQNDVAIPSLRAAGFVSLRASGADPSSGPNTGRAALQANLIDITGLDVATPQGSVDVLFNTSKKIELGNADALREGRSLNSVAAGDVKIRSIAGSIVALDAPVAGGNARAVRVATTAALADTINGQSLTAIDYVPGSPGVTAGALRGTGNLNAWLGVQIQPLRVGDRVLVKDEVDQERNGVYTLSVISTPTWATTTNFTLIRSADADTAAEFPTNTFVRVGERQVVNAANVDQTGTWQVTTAATAADFGTVPITLAQRSVGTDIGSDNPNSLLSFVVSTAGGTNSAAGSLGKMLTLRQQNAARLGGDPGQPDGSQLMEFRFSSAVATDVTPIRLTQELPEITEAFTINGSQTYSVGGAIAGKAAPPVIDGSRITHTRSDRLVAAGDVVNGFAVSGAGASGTVIRDVTVGGFSRVAGGVQSAAIDVRDADGVLVSNVTLGSSELGIRLANGVGVRFSGAGVTSGTLLNNRVFGSNDTGLSVENGATGVSVVGSTFGRADNFNGVGATLSSGVNQFGVDPVTAVRPIPQVQASRVATNQLRFTLPANPEWSPWRLVPGMQILSPRVTPTNGNARATISKVATSVSNLGVTTVTVTVAGGTVSGVNTDQFAVTFLSTDPAAIPDTLATRVENRFTLPNPPPAGIVVGMQVNGPNVRLTPGSRRATIARIIPNGTVTTFEIAGGTVVANQQNDPVSVTFVRANGTRFSQNVTKVVDTFTIAAAARGVASLLYVGLPLTGPTIQAAAVDTPASIVSPLEWNLATGVTTVKIAGGVLTGNGNVSFGHVVATTLSGRTITLPSTVNMDNLFLGQTVRGNGIAGSTVITAIDRAARTVTFAEDRLMTRTGFSVVSFDPGGRNTVTQNRTGLILAGGASTVANTTISANTLNGVEIRGSGWPVGAPTRHHRIGTSLAPAAGSNQIHSNGGWGIYFTPAANGAKNSVTIEGNLLGTTSTGVVPSTLANRKGNVGHFNNAREEVFAGLSGRLVPRGIDGMDAAGNQHGRYQASAGGGSSGSGGVR